MPSEREGAIPDEVGHNEVSRCFLFVASLPGSRGRVKRDQAREVEVLGLDSVCGWEEDVPESDEDAQERAQQVVHLVEGRRGASGGEGWCWKTDDQRGVLYEQTSMLSERPPVCLIGSGTTKRKSRKETGTGGVLVLPQPRGGQKQIGR